MQLSINRRIYFLTASNQHSSKSVVDFIVVGLLLLRMLVLTLLLVASLQCATAFRPIARNCNLRSYRTALNDQKLERCRDDLFLTIKDELGLKLTDFTDFHQCKQWIFGQYQGTTEWWDEKLGSKLTGVSKNSLQSSDLSLYTINGWMGPS